MGKESINNMVNISGFDELVRKLSTYGSNVDQFVKNEIAATGFQIVADAKSNVSSIPNAPAEIKQMISNSVTNNGYTAKINQNALPMGAYIEFGTGVYVTVAPEWKDLAWQFYVNGKGRLRAHPYMYPAFIKGRDEFIKVLEAKLRQLQL
jgi:hypothetical protein